jgi:hypothetical protein
MSNAQRGKLILQEVPAGDVEKKVVMLLLKFAKNASVEALTKKVRNVPYALSNDIAAEKAVLILEAFQKLGATAAFVPHRVEEPAAEPFTPVESEPRFTFHSPEAPEKTSLPVQPAIKKNGMRRLTTFLVTILLLLSLGYLAWQLWPVFGDKVLEFISYLKQLI